MKGSPAGNWAAPLLLRNAPLRIDAGGAIAYSLKMNTKALVRVLYANVPGLAAARFALGDFLSPYASKPEYVGARLIRPGLIVDIGANRGQSIEAFKRLSPGSTIVAFEPVPKAAARLAAKYKSDPAITVHDCALGERAGTITLFVPRYGRWECDAVAATSYAEATAMFHNPARIALFDESKLTVAEYTVEQRTLDSYELAPTLIKLHAAADADQTSRSGTEYAILKGARNTILAHKPALMCAFPTTAVTELLSEWGYGPRVHSNAHGRETFTWYLTTTDRS
jgi:FkbM family methyltransferase